MALDRDDTGANTPARFTNLTPFGLAAISVRATAGRLYQATITNTSATAYFIQFHDKATAALTGESPIWFRRLTASSETFVNFDPFGLYFANGISIAISSTASTLTMALADNAIACGFHGSR